MAVRRHCRLVAVPAAAEGAAAGVPIGVVAIPAHSKYET